MSELETRQKILFLTQVLPYPLTGGAKIRAYYMLRFLAENHRLTLVTFVREDDEADAIAHLGQFCEAVHTVPMRRSHLKNVRSLVESVILRQPLVIVRDRLPEMQKMLRKLVGRESFDIIHADQTSMAQYALFARDACHDDKKSRLLLDQHNALYLLFQRQARHERARLRRILWTRESKLLARYESSLLNKFDEIISVTSNDREALLDLVADSEKFERGEHITVVPISVDPTNQPLLRRETRSSTIIHLGTMFWPPNVEGVLWFILEVLPRIVEVVPDANFVIAGKNPPQEIVEFTSRKWPISAHIQVTGFVADPLPLLSSSQVFAVPLLAGGGMRVKILDAWQWGIPIVSTSIGAEGIAIRPGENILLADKPDAFANAIIRVLTGPELAAGLRTNGRLWVEQHYDWRKEYLQIGKVYGRLVSDQ